MPCEWLGYKTDKRTWEERERDAMKARRSQRRRERRGKKDPSE